MIKDYTHNFVNMLLNSSKWEDFAPSIGILSDRGWGKSCLEFMIDTLLLTGDPNRRVKIYQAPEKLLEEIKKAFPPIYADRFDIIYDVFDIEANDIIGIDEAGHVLDGKKALTKEQREFIAGLTYARHNHCVVVWCTVHPGISKHLNILSEIRIYKHMNWDYAKALIEDGDYYVKEKINILTRLPINKALFRANYKYFTDKKGKQIYEGGLILDKDIYCKWYSEGISQNMYGESFASERNKELKMVINLDPIVQEVLTFYGKELRMGQRNALIHGYFQKFKPEEYQRYKNYISDIGYQALCELFIQKRDQVDNFSNLKIKAPEIELSLNGNKESSGFIPYLEKFYMENLPNEIMINNKTHFEKETIIEILKSWSSGIGIREIAIPIGENKTISQLIINDILKLFKDGSRKNSAIPNDLRLYKIYEFWIAHITKAQIHAGEISEPDIFYEIDGKKYPGECKLYDNIQKNIAMDKRAKLKPSLDFCIKNKIPFYPLFWRNVKWGDVDFVFTIPVEGSNIINLEPLEGNILNNFNAEQFYFNFSYELKKKLLDLGDELKKEGILK